MKFNLTTILLIALIIYWDISIIKLFVKVAKGRLLLSKAKKNNETIIKGISSIYKTSNYIIAVCIELFFIFVLFRLLFIYKLPLILFIIIFVEGISLIVQVLIHIVAIFKEKYVHLTRDGLIYYIGYFEFSKCRFSWETTNNPNTLSNTLHVYKPKEKFPFTAIFDQETELAHKITDENSKL